MLQMSSSGLQKYRTRGKYLGQVEVCTDVMSKKQSKKLKITFETLCIQAETSRRMIKSFGPEPCFGPAGLHFYPHNMLSLALTDSNEPRLIKEKASVSF